MSTVAAIASGLAEKYEISGMIKKSKIVPPIVRFYGQIDIVEDCINFIVGKTLDASNLQNNI